MQVKLDRKHDIIVKSWINDKPITDENWNVFYTDNDNEMIIVLIDPSNNTQVKIEVSKKTNYEDNKKEN